MNRIILIILTLLIGLQSYAIKPTRKSYSNTPSKMELEHEVLRIETKDGISLNVWHLPSADPGTPIIISQSDAGNMRRKIFLRVSTGAAISVNSRSKLRRCFSHGNCYIGGD